jgi:hypothetical protein
LIERRRHSLGGKNELDNRTGIFHTVVFAGDFGGGVCARIRLLSTIGLPITDHGTGMMIFFFQAKQPASFHSINQFRHDAWRPGMFAKMV